MLAIYVSLREGVNPEQVPYGAASFIADLGCNAKPEPAEIARLDAEDAQRRATRREIRLPH